MSSLEHPPAPNRAAWSIGLLRGPSPLRLEPPGDQPLLTASDVGDLDAEFVADPFLAQDRDRRHLLFEIMPRDRGPGVIGTAEQQADGRWCYGGVVLAEPGVHLSYPHAFAWEGAWYMVPESLAAGRVQLHRARAFPREWAPVATLVPEALADPTPFFHDGHWWMLACGRPRHHDTLRLFGAPHLQGPWREHPASPVVEGDPLRGRPAGRVVVHDGRLLRFSQDCRSYYGRGVKAIEIVRLDERGYEERDVDDALLLGPSLPAWCCTGIHHLDAQPRPDGSWLACVDGRPAP